ncbi:MAG: S16 family serine protease [archaeon]
MPNSKKTIEYNPKKKSRVSNSLVVLIIILSIFNILMFAYDISFNKKSEDKIIITQTKIPDFVSMNNITVVSMKVPAVDDKNNGMSTLLMVEAMPGTGRTLVDIDNLLFWADTQQSIRTARKVAANITGLDINSYDLIYSIQANATVIGGESAGAAITITTIAALEKKRINESVMITGTINHDGTIGPISEILSKAKAAKRTGAELFLVPLLQSRDAVYETSQHCEKFGASDVCTIEQVPRKISVNEEAGITLYEVSSVREAIKYMIY